jgi:hypothetical protein
VLEISEDIVQPAGNEYCKQRISRLERENDHEYVTRIMTTVSMTRQGEQNFLSTFFMNTELSNLMLA